MKFSWHRPVGGRADKFVNGYVGRAGGGRMFLMFSFIGQMPFLTCMLCKTNSVIRDSHIITFTAQLQQHTAWCYLLVGIKISSDAEVKPVFLIAIKPELETCFDGRQSVVPPFKRSQPVAGVIECGTFHVGWNQRVAKVLRRDVVMTDNIQLQLSHTQSASKTIIVHPKA